MNPSKLRPRAKNDYQSWHCQYSVGTIYNSEPSETSVSARCILHYPRLPGSLSISIASDRRSCKGFGDYTHHRCQSLSGLGSSCRPTWKRGFFFDTLHDDCYNYGPLYSRIGPRTPASSGWDHWESSCIEYFFIITINLCSSVELLLIGHTGREIFEYCTESFNCSVGVEKYCW